MPAIMHTWRSFITKEQPTGFERCVMRCTCGRTMNCSASNPTDIRTYFEEHDEGVRVMFRQRLASGSFQHVGGYDLLCWISAAGMDGISVPRNPPDDDKVLIVFHSRPPMPCRATAACPGLHSQTHQTTSASAIPWSTPGAVSQRSEHFSPSQNESLLKLDISQIYFIEPKTRVRLHQQGSFHINDSLKISSRKS